MTQTRLVQTIFFSSVLALTLSSVPLQAAKIKCWKNSDGIRECGNIVPPEYAQKGHDEVSSQGITTKHHERALNKEELAERKRLAKEEKAAKQAREEQQRKDNVLLNTFANEDEILMARNGKITTIRTEIRLTYKSLNKAKDHMSGLRKQAANSERSGKPAPKKLAQNITQTQGQIDKYERFISAKKAELDRINMQFEEDLARYKELRKPRKEYTNPK